MNFVKNLRNSREEHIQKSIENNKKPHEIYRKSMEIQRGLPTENHKKIIEILRNFMKNQRKSIDYYVQKTMKMLENLVECVENLWTYIMDYLQKTIRKYWKSLIILLRI